MKKILPQNFSHLSPVLLTPLINIHSRLSPQILKKFETIPMGYSGALGTLNYEKNLKSKISCQTPLNLFSSAAAVKAAIHTCIIMVVSNYCI
jgi:hypothetical protein